MTVHNITPVLSDLYPLSSQLIAAAPDKDEEEGIAPRQLSMLECLFRGGLSDVMTVHLLSELPLQALVTFGRVSQVCFQAFRNYDFKGRIGKIDRFIKRSRFRWPPLPTSHPKFVKYFQNGLYPAFARIENPKQILFNFVNGIEDPKIGRNYVRIFNIMASLLIQAQDFSPSLYYRIYYLRLVDPMKRYLEELNGPRKERPKLWDLVSSFFHEFSPHFSSFHLQYDSNDEEDKWRTSAYNWFYSELLTYELGKLTDAELDEIELIFEGKSDPFAPLMPIVLSRIAADKQIGEKQEAEYKWWLERRRNCHNMLVLTTFVGSGVVIGLATAALGGSGLAATTLGFAGSIGALILLLSLHQEL